jgi:hypothetical protein
MKSIFAAQLLLSADVAGVLHCLGGDPCKRKMKNLHSSTPQKVTEAYSLSL